jgi:hypothetical protein
MHLTPLDVAWRERNRIREGEGRRIVESLVHSIEAYAAEINKVYMRQPSQRLKERKKWCKPISLECSS